MLAFVLSTVAVRASRLRDGRVSIGGEVQLESSPSRGSSTIMHDSSCVSWRCSRCWSFLMVPSVRSHVEMYCEVERVANLIYLCGWITKARVYTCSWIPV